LPHHFSCNYSNQKDYSIHKYSDLLHPEQIEI
jgi:hypothetical protein